MQTDNGLELTVVLARDQGDLPPLEFTTITRLAIYTANQPLWCACGPICHLLFELIR